MYKYFLPLLLLLFLPLCESSSLSYAQTAKFPVLSEKQMFADFDMFTDMVKEISPQNPVRKKVTGITVLQDGHSSLLWKSYLSAEDGRRRGFNCRQQYQESFYKMKAFEVLQRPEEPEFNKYFA